MSNPYAEMRTARSLCEQQAQLLQQQQMLLQQQNAAARQGGVPVQQAPNVAQLRAPQVGISQQQRTGTPISAAAVAAANARLSPQQMYQVQAQQQAQQARALAAAQAALAGTTANGAGLNGASHLSPPYAARAASGSPAMQQAAAIQATASSSPRPPSAQAAASAVPAAAVQRPAPNFAHYFPSVGNGAAMTSEQMIGGLQALLVLSASSSKYAVRY